MVNIMEWKDIIDYSTMFEVSDCGLVKRKDGYVLNHGTPVFHKGQVLKPIITKSGYEEYRLRDKGKIYYTYGHILVFCAFNNIHVAELKEMGLEINHIDCNKRNNNINNLEAITHKQNIQHAIEHGRWHWLRGEHGHFSSI